MEAINYMTGRPLRLNDGGDSEGINLARKRDTFFQFQIIRLKTPRTADMQAVVDAQMSELRNDKLILIHKHMHHGRITRQLMRL